MSILDLRLIDIFAIQALPSVIAADPSETSTRIAARAYEIAEAMVLERDDLGVSSPDEEE